MEWHDGGPQSQAMTGSGIGGPDALHLNHSGDRERECVCVCVLRERCVQGVKALDCHLDFHYVMVIIRDKMYAPKILT